MCVHHHKTKKMQPDNFIQTEDGIYLEIDSSSGDSSKLHLIDRTHKTTGVRSASLKDDESDESSFFGGVSFLCFKKGVSTKLG